MGHCSKGVMAVAAICVVLFGSALVTAAGEKAGTLKDLAKLAKDKNLAAGCFDKAEISIDASKLEKTNHYSKYSKWFDLKPKGSYTLAVVYRAGGPSLVSAGVKWRVAGQPMGLVDREDHYACWPEAADWTLKTLTFTADPEYVKTQIILKAYGGMKAEFKAIKLVEGWYADR